MAYGLLKRNNILVSFSRFSYALLFQNIVCREQLPSGAVDDEMNVKVSFVCRNSIAHGGKPGSCTAHKLFLRKSRTPVRVRQAAADASDRVPHNLSDLAPIVLRYFLPLNWCI